MTMAASPDPDTLLGALMSPDNAVRRNAEATWEDMKRQVPDEVCSWCRDSSPSIIRSYCILVLYSTVCSSSSVSMFVQQYGCMLANY